MVVPVQRVKQAGVAFWKGSQANGLDLLPVAEIYYYHYFTLFHLVERTVPDNPFQGSKTTLDFRLPDQPKDVEAATPIVSLETDEA